MLKAQAAEARGDDAIALAFRAKQRDEPSSPLPLDFPFLAELAVAGYLAKDDLIGADVDELRAWAHLPHSGAAAVLEQAPLIP